MSIRESLLDLLKKEDFVTTSQAVKLFKVSRAYAQRLLHELHQEGVVELIGKARQARYVLTRKTEQLKAERLLIKQISLQLWNKGLDESLVFERVERETGIFLDVKKNVTDIVRYAFTEMLNNAIDHSDSEKIVVECRRTGTAIVFTVRDFGIGAFNNVRKTRHLPNTLAAIQDLLKGKATTMPERHSGEGIFFTSKAADVFILDSFEKRLTINNLLPDMFVSDRRPLKGTLVTFSIGIQSSRQLVDVFKRHTSETDGGHAFSKTRVHIRLHDLGTTFLSRSEAKRVLVNLEQFQEVELDFEDVDTIGQSFADEVFRVWKKAHPETKFLPINMTENVEFMVRHAGG